jgi:homoserine dehydrogenase
VVVRGNAVGDVMFCGAGAGKLPTASAVVADVIDAVKHLYARKWISWETGSEDFLADPLQLETAWYIRTDAAREKIEREFGQIVIAGEDGAVTAFKTAVMNGKMIKDMLGRGIQALSLFRVLGDY